MTEEVYTIVKMIVGIAAIIGSGYAFLKLIGQQAKTDADLRNEILNLENEIKENNEQVEKLLIMLEHHKEKMDQQLNVISIRLKDVTILEKMINQQQILNDKISNKMDSFNDSLNEIKILLASKLPK